MREENSHAQSYMLVEEMHAPFGQVGHVHQAPRSMDEAIPPSVLTIPRNQGCRTFRSLRRQGPERWMPPMDGRLERLRLRDLQPFRGWCAESTGPPICLPPGGARHDTGTCPGSPVPDAPLRESGSP